MSGYPFSVRNNSLGVVGSRKEQYAQCVSRNDYGSILRREDLFKMAYAKNMTPRAFPYMNSDNLFSRVEKIRIWLYEHWKQNIEKKEEEQQIEVFSEVRYGSTDPSFFISDVVKASAINRLFEDSLEKLTHDRDAVSYVYAQHLLAILYPTIERLGGKKTECGSLVCSVEGNDLMRDPAGGVTISRGPRKDSLVTKIGVVWKRYKPYKIDPCLVRDLGSIAEDLLKSFYADYKKKSERCTLVLTGDSDSSVKVNPIIFEAIEDFKERGVNKITFPRASLDTIETFVELLYGQVDVELKDGLKTAGELLALVCSYNDAHLTRSCVSLVNREAEKTGIGSKYKASVEKTDDTARKILEIIFHQYESQSEECDITLEAKDGQVKVNSFIFEAVDSEMLKKVLKGPKEVREKKIRFPEYSIAALKSFIEFMHHGSSVEFELERAFELFPLAHMYHIESLMNHCINTISRETTPQDAPQVINLADTYDNQNLKDLANVLNPTLFKECNSSKRVRLE